MATPSTIEKYTELDPDVRLMLSVRDGDTAAFEQLVARYQGRLLTILQHWLGARDQAEDLVQEVFLRVFRSRGSYEPAAHFSTWIFTIAHNVAKNANRKMARRREVNVAQQSTESRATPSLASMAKAASDLMPTLQVDKREMADVVNLAIRRLNERQRMAILLSKFEGMSYDEVGVTMQMSPSAVKSLMARARDNLREYLEPYLRYGKTGPTKGSLQDSEESDA